MKQLFKRTLLPLFFTLSFSAAANPSRDLREALQEKDFGPVRSQLEVALQNAQPTQKMPSYWTGTRSVVFESAPIGNYRLYAALPDGTLPDVATLRTLIAKDRTSTIQLSRTGNLLASYALPNGRSMRFAMIRRDQKHLRVQDAPEGADKRFFMAAVNPQNVASEPLTPTSLLFSGETRARLQNAIQGHDLASIRKFLSMVRNPDYMASAQSALQGLEQMDLLGANTGLRTLGLPPLQEIKAPKFIVRGKNTQNAYVLRTLKDSDIPALSTLISDHEAQGNHYIHYTTQDNETRLDIYFQKYAAHFLPKPTEELWVLEDLTRKRLAGCFSYNAHTCIMIHPDYRGQGLGHAVQDRMFPYFKRQLQQTRLSFQEISYFTNPEAWNALFNATDFETFVQWAPACYVLNLEPYQGFEADIDQTNIASMRILAHRMAVRDFGHPLEGHYHFVFPPQEENAGLRQKIKGIFRHEVQRQRCSSQYCSRKNKL